MSIVTTSNSDWTELLSTAVIRQSFEDYIGYKLTLDKIELGYYRFQNIEKLKARCIKGIDYCTTFFKSAAFKLYCRQPIKVDELMKKLDEIYEDRKKKLTKKSKSK